MSIIINNDVIGPSGETELSGATTSTGNDAGVVVVSDVGVISQSRNRNRDNASTTRTKFTWNVADNIREIKIIVTSNTGTPDGIESLAACFNAGNDAIADAWLTEANSETTDVQYELITVDTSTEHVFRFTSPLIRLDLKQLSGAATELRVFVGGH